MNHLADRIRAIVKAPAVVEADVPRSPTDHETTAHVESVESALGGEWRAGCFLVERRMDPATRHGDGSVGDFGASLAEAGDQAPLIAAGAAARAPFVFFDLETTGLSGGAGTYAFLVGCGRFAEDHGFITRQYLLVQFADERPLLAKVTDELVRAGAIVTFNGKCFDAPVLETRYLFHRLDWIGARLPHIDVLHPARRFWGLREEAREPMPAHDCSLAALERHVLGARRAGDVAGFQIPRRYFQFVRSGNALPLAGVLEHNRIDLLSLAGITIRLLEPVRRGPEAARDAREALALGRLYTRVSQHARALIAYERAADISASGAKIDGTIGTTVDSFRSLALAYRREQRYAEAAVWWRRLLDVPGCPALAVRQATEALAIHHEHRVRDLQAARIFALRSLQHATPVWNAGVQHRLARIDRRIEKQMRYGALLD